MFDIKTNLYYDLLPTSNENTLPDKMLEDPLQGFVVIGKV